MFIRNIEDALLKIFKSNLEVEMKPDYENSPEPDGDYGTVGVTIVNQVERGSTNSWSASQDSLKERFKRDFRVLVTITFFGETAYQNCFDASSIINFPSIQEKLFDESCLSIIDNSTIRRIPQLRETKYIDRSTFDITLLIGHEALVEADWFDTVGYLAVYPEVDLEDQDYVPSKPPNI